MKNVRILFLIFVLLLAGCGGAPGVTSTPQAAIPLADYLIHTPKYRIWGTEDGKYAYEVGSVENPILSGIKERGPAPQIRELYPFLEIASSAGPGAMNVQYVNTISGESSEWYCFANAYDAISYLDNGEYVLKIAYFAFQETSGEVVLVVEQPFETDSQEVYKREIVSLFSPCEIQILDSSNVEITYERHILNPLGPEEPSASKTVTEQLQWGWVSQREQWENSNPIDDYFSCFAPADGPTLEMRVKAAQYRMAWQAELVHAISHLRASAYPSSESWSPSLTELLDQLENSAVDYAQIRGEILSLMWYSNAFHDDPENRNEFFAGTITPIAMSYEQANIYRELTLDIYDGLVHSHDGYALPWDGMFIFDAIATHEELMAMYE